MPMTAGKKVKEPIDEKGINAELTTGQAVRFAREYNDMTQTESQLFCCFQVVIPLKKVFKL